MLVYRLSQHVASPIPHTWHQRPPFADVNARTECPWHKRLRSNGHVEARIARVAKARRVQRWRFGTIGLGMFGVMYTNMDHIIPYYTNIDHTDGQHW